MVHQKGQFENDDLNKEEFVDACKGTLKNIELHRGSYTRVRYFEVN